MAKPTRRNRRSVSPKRASFRLVTPPDAPRSGRLARFTPARGRSITTPSQHVRPALRAARPHFAALLSPCAQGSALLIFSVSLCQYERCALFLPQLATGDTSLHTRLRRWFLTPCSCVPPVDICCDSACTPGASRPLVEKAAARRPNGLPSASSLLRKCCSLSLLLAAVAALPLRFYLPCTHGSALDATSPKACRSAAPGPRFRNTPARSCPSSGPE